MKTIHKLVLKAYLGPMVLTFFIVMFVLMMNIVWRYIDELVGKGLSAGIIIELMTYFMANMIPLGLPLAMLLAAIMTMGNLGENYELLAMKSAGMSLVRITKPLIILVSVIVMITSVVSLLIFVNLYRNDMEQNAITTSEQAVVQVKNTVFNYTEDMSDIMQMICANIQKEEEEANNFFSNLLKIRSDVVAVTSYDMNGKILKCWTNGQKLKENYIKNLSYVRDLPQEEGILNITKPHVESLFVDYYPWVVTISQNMQDANGNTIQVAVDISFYNIADYVDDVGIGQHGYCYIADDAGNIVYHPQQQLIYASLKEENQKNMENGTYIKSNVIYTVNSLQNCDWHIVGVCYVDEMITNKVERVVSSLVVILAIVLAGTVFLGSVFSDLLSKPVRSLVRAMGEFEGNSAEFVYHPVTGTKEISALSDSFEHMAVRIQKLMEEVRLGKKKL